MAKRKRLGELLVEACVISPQQLDTALHIQQGKRQLLGQILIDLGWSSESEICRAVAEILNVGYVDVDRALISQDIVQLAPEALAVKRNVLPLFIQDKTLYVAMENPLDVDVIQRLEFTTGMQIKPLIAPPSQLRDTVRKHYNLNDYVGTLLDHVAKEEAISVEPPSNAATEAVDISEARKASADNQIIRLTNMLIADGIKKRASDIHIEPTAEAVELRYRIDGLLTRGAKVPKWLQLPLISRLKVISGMDIAEHRKPQDGRISVTYSRRKIDLRVSTLLTNCGEKIVIRILDTQTTAHDLKRLGISDAQLQAYWNLIRQPQGWVLVTGPTGSGKTTTLYASLQTLKDSTKNIITVEDPIEYQLPGINQVQVNPKAGLTFATGLRSILRQDPNVILVGEIRDAETAEIAMQASETGHLVLSTLHTNDAVSTVNRLFNLGVAPDLVASNLLGIVAQRLVRRICPHCRVEYTPDDAALRSVGLQSGRYAQFSAYKGAGCRECKHTGYHGQLGLYELFAPNDRLREEIVKRPSKTILKQLAVETGMKTMLDDGIEKIRRGLTTIEEVARVCYVEPTETADLLQCPECGKRIAKGDKVCPFCECRFDQRCLRCGAELQRLWMFCPLCGILKPRVDNGAAGSPMPSPKSGARIVIAEDDPAIRHLVQTLLEQQQYQVIPAVDGEDALEKIQADVPDLIVLDINMPRRDGFSVCEAVRSSVDTMFVPVVMLTGQDTMEEKLRGLALGADDYITKPFNADELLARIAAVLRRAYRNRASGDTKATQ